ncbi:FkbM family methyltransferase [Pseudomonas sp. ZM23]|uniref:FkbM family methyltransferase n=1 Tax=Pseudomonas triclosanedens TaxID=2961893 RepID=A0ABY6ZWT6_9PSED|nr:FkbM family methyltransferase [Pseudomonas triclosanedens]MCP8467864.1 FkbM family methyltransferase [Pseudomonas triclosanedens]MCP8469965.1 FkbM family methyltransferase [Pseudomonas triclosanedens]MCP8477875.1 FkbM family methyltransferase [Pseudomonas triclosanedens]WAI49296.1 FkbM family methyltransferase [Pseudomonas triclosanedens]
MKFVSFAQNFEDVMLWRALKHIQNGFYVDVGAFSPDLDSVTKAFYNAGWSGINIEPNPDFAVPYQVNRPRDILVTDAVSDSSGEQEIYIVPSTGLTSMDQGVADHHADKGWTVEPIKVRVRTLAEILEEHAPGRDIHFLKIDVEGLEENVIRGNDWERFRPWILVIEATFPMSQVESHASWEPLILKAGYHFVYADGLNRFYVADNHLELTAAFKYPPNVFDNFVRHDLVEEQAHAASSQEEVVKLNQAISLSSERINILNAQLEQSRADLKSCEQERATLSSQRQALSEQIQALVSSTSWRVTRPLRAFKNLLGQRN